MKAIAHLLTLGVAILSTFTLVACDKPAGETVGQQVDRSISEAKTGMKEATDATKQAAAAVVASAKDTTITTKITAALVSDDQLKATKIEVDTKDGKVVLTGLAPSESARDRATSLASGVEGVVNVDNRLTVSSKG
jgi:hyperosmotically inducible periplasmic protein